MENPQRNPKRSTAFSWLDDLFECVFYLAYRCGMMPFDVKFNEKQDRYEIITISTWQRVLLQINNFIKLLTKNYAEIT